MIQFAIKFIIAFLGSMLLHEYFHLFEGGPNARIELWFWHKIPSLRTIPDPELKNRDLFYLAGGLYTGALFLLFSILATTNEYHIILATIGALQLYYGVYEMYFINRIPRSSYMIQHYILYFVVIGSMLGIYSLYY